MTRYLISFVEGAMTFPEEELPEVGVAAHAVTHAAQDAGVWVFGGGLTDGDEGSLVATEGTITEGADRAARGNISGFTIVDVPSREDAMEWAARFAVACRCAQEVREIMDDPDLGSNRVSAQ
jgi:hypothetical protein